MKKQIISIVLLSFILLFSCNSTKKSADEGDETTKKSEMLKKMITEYTIIEIYGLETLAKKPTMKIDFEKNVVSGNAACNQYGGNIIRKGNTIRFDRLMATKMYCSEFNKIEKSFMKMLSHTHHYKVEGNKIKLYDKADALLIVGKE